MKKKSSFSPFLLLAFVSFAAFISFMALAQTLPNAAPMPTPQVQYLDSAGHPLAGAKLCTYAAGTSTPLATYTSSAGSGGSSNANPVILDSYGRASVWVGPALYKFVLRTGGDGSCTTGTVQWTQDNVTDATLCFVNWVKAAGTSTIITFTQSGTGAVQRTADSKFKDTYSVTDFGAVADITTDNAPTFQAAIDACPSTGCDILIPRGTYKTQSHIVLKSGVRFHGNGNLASIVKAYGNDHAFYGSKVQYVSFQDMQIYDGLGIGSRTTGDAIFLDGTGGDTRFVMDRVYTIGFENGIHATISGYSSLRNTRVVSPAADCYLIDGALSVQTRFENTGASSCGAEGYHLENGSYSSFSGTFADGATGDGYHVKGGSNTVFSATSAEGGSSHGYELESTANVVMNAISVSKSTTQDGIRLNGANWVNILSPLMTTITGWGINSVGSDHFIFLSQPHFDTCTAGNVNDPGSEIVQLYNNVFPALTIGNLTTTQASLHNASVDSLTATDSVISPLGSFDTLSASDAVISPLGSFGAGNFGTGAIGTDTIHAEATNTGHFMATLRNLAAAGSSHGLNINAGGNSSDFALSVWDRTGATELLEVRGNGMVRINGSGQIYANTYTCDNTSMGGITTITDSNTVTWGATIAGGAGGTVLAFCDGTHWTVIGK